MPHRQTSQKGLLLLRREILESFLSHFFSDIQYTSTLYMYGQHTQLQYANLVQNQAQ